MNKPLLALVLLVCGVATLAVGQEPWRLFLPEQGRIEIRDPSELAHAHIPETPPPMLVSNEIQQTIGRHISLDEAIRIALENAEIVRVLTGIAASSSGRSIYDTAIANTQIEDARSVFDPTISVQNNFNRFDSPRSFFDPLDPLRAVIQGTTASDHDLRLDLSKKMVTGGVLSFGVNSNSARSRTSALPLNPESRSSLELSLSQPLLQGGGIAVNLVPIVLARIDTERSYFQFKDSVQELVRGVIEAYWQLVNARINLWSRRQQVEQGKEAFELAQARLDVGLGDAGDVAQSQAALAGFRANAIGAEANVFQREAALQNILGLPPEGPIKFIPVTPLSTQQFEFSWKVIIELAEVRRPDLIELKLIIEADEQRLIQARNQTLPRVDANLLYRWNGLEGTMPNGASISTAGGEYADWMLGVNFSVPLGLRQGRAAMRRQELLISRDQANLQQGLHSAIHILANNLRNLALNHQQFEAFTETRTASLKNLEIQSARFHIGQNVILLNVLQAISDWGNAVSSQSQSLTFYNIELANLERQTGTILESHGVRFFEERFGSLGPLGRLFPYRCYPESLRISHHDDRYPVTERPAEEAFGLNPPENSQRRRLQKKTEENDKLKSSQDKRLKPWRSSPSTKRQVMRLPSIQIRH